MNARENITFSEAAPEIFLLLARSLAARVVLGKTGDQPVADPCLARIHLRLLPAVEEHAVAFVSDH